MSVYRVQKVPEKNRAVTLAEHRLSTCSMHHSTWSKLLFKGKMAACEKNSILWSNHPQCSLNVSEKKKKEEMVLSFTYDAMINNSVFTNKMSEMELN